MLIDWAIVQELCPDIRGIIHVGAYNAAEAKYYNVPTKWIEADPDLFEALTVEDKYHFAATDYRGIAKFNIMEFKPANSLLAPNLNAKRRSDVRIIDRINVPADRIDSIQEDENMLVMDIQGAELNALKGADLDRIDYILTEVHNVETYHGCTQVGELDDYLTDFERVKTHWTKKGWGDAVYIRTR